MRLIEAAAGLIQRFGGPMFLAYLAAFTALLCAVLVILIMLGDILVKTFRVLRKWRRKKQ